MIIPITLAILGLGIFLLGITMILHQKQINQLAERLDKLSELLAPVIAREAELKLGELSSEINSLAEVMEKAGADDPEVQEILAPHVKHLRDSAWKLEGGKETTDE